MKQCDITLEQARSLVNELGFARLTEPRARDLHPDEPVPAIARKVHLPRKWRGREAELHQRLNEAVIPVLQAEFERTVAPAARAELELMIRFAKKVKYEVRPIATQGNTKADAA